MVELNPHLFVVVVQPQPIFVINITFVIAIFRSLFPRYDWHVVSHIPCLSKQSFLFL